MKCPHCGIYYMDDERVCPVCGKRSGISTPPTNSPLKKATSVPPEKKIKYKNNDTTSKPIQPKQTQTFTHKQPKKSSRGCGCLIVIILIVAFSIISSVVSNLIFSSTPDVPAWEDSGYESTIISDILPSGSWTADVYDLTITIHPDDTITWTDGIDTARDDYPVCFKIPLTDEKAEEYELNELIPFDSFTLYNLSFRDADSPIPDCDLYIFIPNDIETENITHFPCYDWDEEEWVTFSYQSKPTTVPAP